MNIKNIITAMRAPFLAASLLPALITIVWLWAQKITFSIIDALLAVFGIIMVHLLSNTINDYFDWDKSDKINKNTGPFSGGSRKVLEGILPRKTFLILAIIFFCIAIGISTYFILTGKPYVLLIGLVSGALGYFYSSPPIEFQSRGLGELVIFLTFGPLISFGTGYALTGKLLPLFFLLGVPNGILTTCLIWINEFPDLEADKTSGKKNMVVRFGLDKARYIFPVMHLIFYVSIIALVIWKVFPLLSLTLLATLPLSIINTQRLFVFYKEPAKLIPSQAMAIQTQLISGIITILSIALFRII